MRGVGHASSVPLHCKRRLRYTREPLPLPHSLSHDKRYDPASFLPLRLGSRALLRPFPLVRPPCSALSSARLVAGDDQHSSFFIPSFIDALMHMMHVRVQDMYKMHVCHLALMYYMWCMITMSLILALMYENLHVRVQ